MYITIGWRPWSKQNISIHVCANVASVGLMQYVKRWLAWAGRCFANSTVRSLPSPLPPPVINITSLLMFLYGKGKKKKTVFKSDTVKLNDNRVRRTTVSIRKSWQGMRCIVGKLGGNNRVLSLTVKAPNLQRRRKQKQTLNKFPRRNKCSVRFGVRYFLH